MQAQIYLATWNLWKSSLGCTDFPEVKRTLRLTHGRVTLPWLEIIFQRGHYSSGPLKYYKIRYYLLATKKKHGNSFSVGMLSCYGQKGDQTKNMSKITKENTALLSSLQNCYSETGRGRNSITQCNDSMNWILFKSFETFTLFSFYPFMQHFLQTDAVNIKICWSIPF